MLWQTLDPYAWVDKSGAVASRWVAAAYRNESRMVHAAEFGTGQVLWSIFWFFLFFMFVWLVISVLGDIFRSGDLSGVAKALWVIALIFLPYLGVLLYLIVRGDEMSERAIQDAEAREKAVRSYIQDAAGSASLTDELSKLANLKADGTLDDAEYAAAKARLLGQSGQQAPAETSSAG